jgi:hypothetical protein
VFSSKVVNTSIRCSKTTAKFLSQFSENEVNSYKLVIKQRVSKIKPKNDTIVTSVLIRKALLGLAKVREIGFFVHYVPFYEGVPPYQVCRVPTI